MATERITVMQYTKPQYTFVLKNFRDLSDPNAVVNITGYTFHLVVKRAATDTDADAWFTLTGTITDATNGEVRFDFTQLHTARPAGTFPGQIRWWTGVTTAPPNDSLSVDFVVEQAMKRS